MHSIYEFITFTTKIEHDLEHDSNILPSFSPPKIYTANGDISKRWYVYFSYRNPESGKLKRMPNIYGKTNKYKTKEARLSILTSYRRNLLFLLKQGFNPFIDNSDLYKKLKHPIQSKELENNDKETISPLISKTIKTAVKEALEEKIIISDGKKVDTNISTKINTSKYYNQKLKEKENVSKELNSTISDAFEFALKLKEKVVSENTIKDYKRKAKLFTSWLKKEYPEKKYIKEITRKNILEYLNSILIRTSARNRNNYRTELGSLFQVLKNNEIIDANHIPSIAVLKSKPKKNKTYTLEEQKNIFNYLNKQDPHLLLFIKFVAYSFIRPLEVCRLKVKDIDLENNTVKFKAKNSPLKTKILPKILLDDLPDLSKLDKESFLFTPEKLGGFWDAKETNRRDHFSKRFRKVVKEHFKLNKDYGIYSFRHTFISKLYNKLREKASPNEAKSDLMLITGHTTIKALDKYLRDIDAELPNDYSELIK